MNREQYINTIISYLSDKGSVREVEAELNCHIDDRMTFFTESGISDEEAERKAIEMMGDPIKVGIELNKLHDNRKLKITAIILMIAEFLLSVFSFSVLISKLNNFDLFSDIVNVPMLVLVFLLCSVIYKILCKIRNSSLLKVFGIINANIIIFVTICPFISQFTDNIFPSELTNMLSTVAGIIIPKIYGIVSVICTLTAAMLFVCIIVLSIGYGKLIDYEYDGLIRTNVRKRFEAAGKVFLSVSVVICVLNYIYPLVYFVTNYVF